MIIEKLDELCVKNGTNLTSLCREITGSSGNLPTWKKDKIRPDWLREICLKFNISCDYLLDLPHSDEKSNFQLTKEERDSLIRFNRLSPDNQIKAQAYMVTLFEDQQSKITLEEKLADWAEEDPFRNELFAGSSRHLDEQGKSSPSSGTEGETKVV